MNNVTIYTIPGCKYCMRAKQLLSELGAQFDEVDLSSNEILRDELQQKYQWQTVPMIVARGEFLGGYDDIARLHAENKLQEKIA